MGKLFKYLFIGIGALTVLAVIIFFGFSYLVINIVKNSDTDGVAKTYVTQMISQVSTDWSQQKIASYLDYEYFVGWGEDEEEFRYVVSRSSKQKSSNADIVSVANKAKQELGVLVSINSIRCFEITKKISCLVDARFAGGDGTVDVGLNDTTKPGDKSIQYKANMLVIGKIVKPKGQ